MEKPSMFSRTCHDHQHQLCLPILIFFFSCSLLLCLDYSLFLNKPQQQQINPLNNLASEDSCAARYIYIHDLPPRFNRHFLHNCKTLTRGTEKPNMCPYMDNMGLGPKIVDPERAFANDSASAPCWYETNQFLLEVIFHNRMKRYECLTNDSSLASAIFVPYYAGLDAMRYLWFSNLTARDESGVDLAKWLARRREWKRMYGRDHFVVSGRIAWDFRRQFDDSAQWGSNFRFLPESMNMSMLAVESSSWNNDYAIPYPTSFHPSRQSEIFDWQSKMRNQTRPHLFTFAGAPRPELEGSVRGKVIEQCRASTACEFVDCSYGGARERCDNPVNVIEVFRSSVFCLQPPGDSYTRRSIFDSMVAGCIPVFFHPGTAYSQYQWFLPKNRSSYSVYIPVEDAKNWSLSVEKVLLGIPEDEVVAMREEVIRLIPRLIYANPGSKLGEFEDAFDVAVRGILERIGRVREAMRIGIDPSIGFADEDNYKYTFSHN